MDSEMRKSIEKPKLSTAIRLLGGRNILIVIIATIGMLPGLFTSGGYYMMYQDITTQMLPFVYETKRMLASGVPFWSWNTFFGDNFLASYACYTVFNPFTWINCLFPYKYLFQGFTIVLYLKFLVCGYVAQAYLRKMGFDERLSLIGCLLYTFSSWAITDLYYYMFLEPMILFPLLLIFVERFLRKEKHWCSGLVMATFVVVAVNYYFASINLIAAALYFFCRLAYAKDEARKKLMVSLRAAGCVISGIICAAAILLPVILQLKGSPHISVSHDVFNIYRIADRLFWLIYPKINEGPFYYLFLHSDWKSNAASIAVFGLLPAVLLVKKRGYGWIKWFTVVLLVIYLTPFNGLFSLFTDFQFTRWAYVLTLAIILCTLYYLRDYGLPRLKFAIWYCAVVYGLYFLFAAVSVYWDCRNIDDSLTSFTAMVMITMNACVVALDAVSLLVLCSMSKPDRIPLRQTLVFIAACTSMQFMIYSFPEVKLPGINPKGMSEAEYFIQRCDFHSDGEFNYRTNFTVPDRLSRPARNFALICNRPSIETYHSVKNAKSHLWSEIIGECDPIRIIYPDHFAKSFEALMSVKHLVIVSGTPVDSVMPGYPTGRESIFSVYESDHYIPMGFAYDRYVLTDSIEDIALNDRTTDVPNALLSALAIKASDEGELAQFLKRGDIDGCGDLDSLVSARKREVCDRFTGNTRGFDAHINLDSARVVFFSVLADDGFTAYIDGAPTKIYETNLGFSSVIVPAGSHDITFRYFPPGLKLGLLISAIGWLITATMFFKRL